MCPSRHLQWRSTPASPPPDLVPLAVDVLRARDEVDVAVARAKRQGPLPQPGGRYGRRLCRSAEKNDTTGGGDLPAMVQWSSSDSRHIDCIASHEIRSQVNSFRFVPICSLTVTIDRSRVPSELDPLCVVRGSEKVSTQPEVEWVSFDQAACSALDRLDFPVKLKYVCEDLPNITLRTLQVPNCCRSLPQ